MATRTLSRRALRDEHDQAEQIKREAEATGETPATEAKAKKARTRKPAVEKAPKAPAKPRVRKKTVKVPPVLFARWAVCDNGMKRVAVFEYRDRAGADAKLAQMQDRKTGTFFLQLVKDPADPPALAAVPAV